MAKRYDEPKLNKKKVFMVIFVIVLIVAAIVLFRNMSKKTTATAVPEKIVSLNYYTCFNNNKWGVIDSNGKTVLQPQYDEMIVIPNKTKKAFVCLYNVNYTDGTYDSKVVNENNETIINGYDKVEAIINKDKDNHTWYFENLLKVTKDGKAGLVSIEGQEMLPCTYDSIEPIEGIESVLKVSREGKYGLVDSIGNSIIDCEVNEIDALTEDYEDGFIVKKEENKYGLIGVDKTQILDYRYDKIFNVAGNGMYFVQEENTTKIVDKKKNKYLEGQLESVKSINSDNIVYSKDGKYGIIKTDGTIVIEPNYEDLTYIFGTYYIAKKDGKYGVIGTSNEEKIPFNYTGITYNKTGMFLRADKENFLSDVLNKNFETKITDVIVSSVNEKDSYIKVKSNSDYKYYDFDLEEKSNKEILKQNTLFLNKEKGKYGFVNSKDVVVVNYEYDDGTEQNEYGYAAIKKNGKWGAINSKGEVIVQPTLDIDDFLVINFLGEWHLAEDYNSNYYIK